MDSKKAVRTYHRNVAVLVGLILLVFILIPTVVKSPYILNIFVLVFYMSTLSMAWNLLGGMTGQNSLGHAAYMGLGAYACCLLVVKTGANPWLAAVFGMAVVLLVVIRFRPTGILGWYMNSRTKRFVDEKILKKPSLEVLEEVQTAEHQGREA